MTTFQIFQGICRSLVLQRAGYPLQGDEEAVKKQLEQLEKEINSPTNFRGRLNELISQLRLVMALEAKNKGIHSVEGTTLEQVKEFLVAQQSSIKHLVDTLHTSIEYAQGMKCELRESK